MGVVRLLRKASKPSLASFEGQNEDKVTSTHANGCFDITWLALVEPGRICSYVSPIDRIGEKLAGNSVCGPVVVGEIHSFVQLAVAVDQTREMFGVLAAQTGALW
jgi:hypothetical protein